MTRGQPDDPSTVIAAAIPALVDALASAGPGRVYRETVAVVERPLIERALALTGGNQLRAARLLGLNRNTLRKRCRQLGLMPAGAPEVATGLK